MTSSDDSLTPRHWIALTALISGMVALYLHLWKKGLMGELSCGGDGACSAVQFSPWSWFMGVDVALIGTVGYALILLVAVAGLFPALRNDRRITVLLAVLIVTGFIFTLRLKYYEFVVMKLFCRWCAVSAATITLQTVLVWLDWRRVKRDGTS